MGEPKWCHVCSGTGTDANGDECICRFTQAFEPKENRFYREAQPRDGYAPPVVDSSEPTAVDLKPITVGGWMRTLPPFENAPAWVDCKRLTDSCFCLQQAISHVALHVNGITAKRYWSGACDRIYCYGTDAYKSKWKAYGAGYAAMDAYLEPEQSPKNVVADSETYSVTVKDGMASMPWADFSKLTDKATAWDLAQSGAQNANGWAVFAIGEACTTIPTTEHAELRRKAAMWDAHEARRIALENADSEFWAKITSIREGFGI